MITYTREQIRRLLKIDFIRFCIVGGTGFVINFIILLVLPHLLPVSVFVSQLIGAEVALGSNFLLHHHWTYKNKKVKKSVRTLLWQFHASSWPAILGSSLMVSAGVRFLHLNKYVALMLTSAIVLGWNFSWSKFVIWRGEKAAEVIQ